MTDPSPGSSLLAGLDADDLARQQRRRPDGKDQPRGREALIDAVLRKYDWDGLPRCNPDPGGLFVDGTDLLHDVDGDGIYTNTFAKVHVEGVYNWTLYVNGVDADQNPFSHRLTGRRWPRSASAARPPSSAAKPSGSALPPSRRSR